MRNNQQLVTWILHTLREAARAPLLDRLFPLLDIPVHFLGGVVITYFYRSTLRHSQKLVGKIPLLVQVLLLSPAPGQHCDSLGVLREHFGFLLWNTQVRGLFETANGFTHGLTGSSGLVRCLQTERKC